MDDLSLLAILLCFFLGLGVILPYMNADFGTDFTQKDFGSALSENLSKGDSEEVSKVGLFDIITSIFSVFFWSFNVNWAINLILMIPRILLVFIIWRNLLPGGSG